MRALLAVAIAIVLASGCLGPPAMSAAGAPQLYTPATEPVILGTQEAPCSPCR